VNTWRLGSDDHFRTSQGDDEVFCVITKNLITWKLRGKARVDVLILDKWDLMKLSAKNERDLLAVRKDR